MEQVGAGAAVHLAGGFEPAPLHHADDDGAGDAEYFLSFGAADEIGDFHDSDCAYTSSVCQQNLCPQGEWGQVAVVLWTLLRRVINLCHAQFLTPRREAVPVSDFTTTRPIPAFPTHYRLRLAVESAQVDPDQIARRLGVHPNTIANYLAGRTRPKRMALAAIADLTDRKSVV